MPSFGEKLKLEREKRKITLEQISSSTKIGTRMLQALEEDKFNQLPGGIFNKGFVRAYSRFVGLDEDQTVADYLEASGDALPVAVEPEVPEDGAQANEERITRLEAISDTPARQLPWGVFAAVLLLVALALSFWSHRRHAKPPVPPAPTTTQAPATQSSDEVPGEVSGQDRASVSPNAGSASAASPRAASTSPGSPRSSSPGTGSPAGRPAPSAQPSPAAAGASSGKTSFVAPKTPQGLAPQDRPAASAAVPGEFTVVVQAREESWLTFAVDGKTTSSELLAAGSERAIRGRKEIVVKVGNAGGVDLRFNGKKLDTEGEFGEVKTVTFGPQGILPNAPAPPSTP